MERRPINLERLKALFDDLRDNLILQIFRGHTPADDCGRDDRIELLAVEPDPLVALVVHESPELVHVALLVEPEHMALLFLGAISPKQEDGLIFAEDLGIPDELFHLLTKLLSRSHRA